MKRTAAPSAHVRQVPAISARLVRLALWIALALLLLKLGLLRLPADEIAADLPTGVTAVWDAAKAFHETTPTRERICLNGLWRWQPAEAKSEAVPGQGWGYFKVPGCWPGITDYMQKDSQTLYPHPSWKETRLGGITAAWQEREFSVPAHWKGRRITLSAEYVNSYAAVFVDGVKAGELLFPGGELDLGRVCHPGTTQRLSLLVVALPLKGVMLSYTDSASAREVAGKVDRRGLCGDVFLVATPTGPRLSEVAVDTSVRERRISATARVDGLAEGTRCRLRARVLQDGKLVREFRSATFQSGDLAEGQFTFGDGWMPEKLWDLNTPENTYDLEVSLTNEEGQTLDQAWTRRFGFREFWIEGRDFHLNGSRVFLSAVPLDNAQVGAALANYAAARESLLRLKSFGINYVYTHNYGCEPGAHLSFTEILRAADDVGMLVGFTQPHFSHYDWKAPDADAANGYARHADFYARAAGNHPSVVMYVMSHNGTGYEEDMNPDMIDGIHDGRDQWGQRNVRYAMRAEAIVRHLDPRRIVYHHASGNLGVMHDSNFYPNFAPVQELDDWFGHWATEGVKPAFTCEYGAPFTWDWTMYRGWYKGEREWGSAVVPWEFCLAEWNAQFFGDRAYQVSDAERRNLRWEAGKFRAGAVWHRWDYPNQVGSDRFDERYPVFAKYITDNWRAYRTWGLSGLSPWEFGHFWKPRPDVNRGRQDLPVDWANLQRPGLSPDYIRDRYERMDLAFDRADWIATPAAESLLRNNGPLLAYIAGKPDAFTSKDHNFLPGETLEKQVIVINNSRASVSGDLSWSLDLPHGVTGGQTVTVPTGEQARVPVTIRLPQGLAPGSYGLRLTATFSTGESQTDRFAIDVLPPPARTTASPASELKIALFDPKGETTAQLAALGVAATSIDANADLTDFGLLIIGKAALTLDGSAPDIRRVRDGLKVVIFEQTAEVLEQRLGFRVTEYGLRQVFARVPDHPLLAGIRPENLRDWRGSATILPARLDYELRSRYGPTVQWAGLPVPRVWRCGNRGNVASVLIEKPAVGDFLPVIDGGFSLQYSPLLEYREGRGMVLFCQMDVTGRTEDDPSAQTLVRNSLAYVTTWRATPRRAAVYAGEAAGKGFLESMGIAVRTLDAGPPRRDDLLVLGPGAKALTGPQHAEVAPWLQGGGSLLAVGLNQEDATALSLAVSLRKGEHIAAWFPPAGAGTWYAGISPAEVHNRDARELPLVTADAEILGDGVLAKATNANAMFVQLAPWQFDGSEHSNVRRTFRRAACLLDRLLANQGVAGTTPLLSRFSQTVNPATPEQRWLTGLYLDQPQEWDDPYRFFRW